MHLVAWRPATDLTLFPAKDSTAFAALLERMFERKLPLELTEADLPKIQATAMGLDASASPNAPAMAALIDALRAAKKITVEYQFVKDVVATRRAIGPQLA